MKTKEDNPSFKKLQKSEVFTNTITNSVKNDSISYQQAVLILLSILGVVAIIAALHFASPILVPITLAIYLNLLLSPIVIFF